MTKKTDKVPEFPDRAPSRRDLGAVLEETWVVKEKTTGWWWRPGSKGYTQELVAAGAVDEETAKSWATRRSPDDRGHYSDEAMSLGDALKGIGEGSVFSEIIDGLTPEPYPWCPECEIEVQRVDEDGCCPSCGTDVFHDEDGEPVNGRDRKIAELKRKIDAITDGDALLNRLEVAEMDRDKLAEQATSLRDRLHFAEGALEEARAAALELRDAWVPKDKHTEFPWEMT